jgi:hypothetical protein
MAALEIAGFEHYEASPAAISRGDDLGAACGRLTGDLTELVRERDAELIIGPHPRDGHHGHATVARAVRQTVWAAQRPLQWWMWSVWADLPRPTLVVDCEPAHLATSMKMLEQHAGENGRNDYREMHDAVRAVNAVRGVEKVFGFGSAPGEQLRGISRAELLTEITARRHRWLIGSPRVLDLDGGVRPPRWSALDDLSLLSSTRLRPFYNAAVMSAFARIGHPMVDPADEGAGLTSQVRRLVALTRRSLPPRSRAGTAEPPDRRRPDPGW